MAAADAFEAKTVDYTRESIVLRVTADSRRIDDFIDLMRDYEILEICRTGRRVPGAGARIPSGK